MLFKEVLKDSKSATLDGLVKQMVLWNHQYCLSAGTQKNMPPLLWKKGVSKLTNTTAGAKVGMLLTIFVVSLTHEGNAFF